MRKDKPHIIIVLVMVMAGWCIYILLLPFISPIMGNIFPTLWQCQYKRIIGHECPFCGITRDIDIFYSTGKFGELNRGSSIYFIVLMVTVIVGIIVLLLCLALKRRARNQKRLPVVILDR